MIVATSLMGFEFRATLPAGIDSQRKGCRVEMMDKENRSYVRGDILFKVKFTLYTREEYENLESSKERHFSLNEGPQEPVFPDSNDPSVGFPDGSLINFLIQMDDKLDQILLLLSKGETKEGAFEEGVGINISGSGMNIIVDKPVESGRVIHAKFFLAKAPFLFMEVFGEVVRVIRLEEKGEPSYQLGIEFLNLNENDRDRIITAVFQHQRQTIRKNKSMDPA
jgi:hypothetical protein